MGEESLPVLLWSGAALLAGLIIGALWNDLRRGQRSSMLNRAQEANAQLQNRSQHYGFGVADLEVRIRAARQEADLLRSEIKIRRATYERLSAELDEQWSAALLLKREQTQQEQRIDALEQAITEWKQRLLNLQAGIERKNQNAELLKQELDAGLAVIDEELTRSNKH